MNNNSTPLPFEAQSSSSIAISTRSTSTPDVVEHEIMWHVLYYFVSVLSGIFNLFLLAVIPSYSQLRKRTTNWFIWTISLIHLLTAIFVIPFNFRNILSPNEFQPTWAPWMCQVRPSIEMGAFLVEILLLMSLASQYIHDFRKNHKDLDLPFWGGFLIITAVLAVSVGVSFPWGYLRKIKTVEEPIHQIQTRVCTPPDNEIWRIFEKYLIFIFGAVVVILTDILFIVCFQKAWKNNQAISGAKKELKVLVSILFKVNILWLPAFLLSFSKALDIASISSWVLQPKIILISGLISGLSALLNPLILLAVSEEYRKGYHRFLTCKCHSDARLDSTSMLMTNWNK